MGKSYKYGFSIVAALLVLAVLALATWGVMSRVYARAALRDEAAASATMTVIVVQAATATKGEDLVLPGSVEPWAEAPIYARTSGYLRRWLVDIGSQVKAGQLLAEIDTPEIDAQLHQTEAELNSARANSTLADATAQRWSELAAKGLVARQASDEKSGDATAKRAALASAQASLSRLRQLTGFKHITAPYDGVITARNVDVGALVNAGAGTSGAAALFQIAAVNKLRVYVQVPQAYARAIQVGLTADLRFADRPAEPVSARVTHTASALDASSRTLRTQLEVDNSKAALLSGGYVDVHFKLPVQAMSLRLPANTLLFRAEGLQVATVSSDDRITLKNVSIGRDFGTTVEISEGLNASDSVVVNPPDSLANGQPVHRAPTPVPTPAPTPTKPVAATQ